MMQRLRNFPLFVYSIRNCFIPNPVSVSGVFTVLAGTLFTLNGEIDR